ncbi:uncharacterized protein HaLaN_09417 [Haematococcus lacustris]|uniref:Uncharacterized protein n=1 Tax=Haematococcus lacustris TaxID=44745 RepID=A0A699YTH3_HAELA|nr:uncharacterized protein HaLaN_09417 [Haematococcus lacustris]
MQHVFEVEALRAITSAYLNKKARNFAQLKAEYHKQVPNGSRVGGLTALDRRVLQLILDAERAGGPSAAARLKVLLAVDSLHTAWVAEQVAARQHYGLAAAQIVIVAMARLPGLLWDEITKAFKVAYSPQTRYHSPGAGYALLALAWPAHAFTVTTMGEREYLQGSVLKMLEEQGYEYLHSTLMCDWECLAAGGALMEASFCAPALYAMDNHGANMAMQVVRAAGDTLARSHNSVVASAPVGPALCSVNVALTDLQTGSTHSVIARQLKEGAVTSCTSRYLYKLASLSRMLTGPAAFKPKVHASRNAYKLARHLMAQDRTQLTLVHVVGPAASLASGEALLASFTDVLTNDQTRRRVVQQSERLMESLLSEVALLDPLLVILGSEALSSPGASSSASVGLQLAKSLFDCSLVIVKNNSCDRLLLCRPHGLDKGSLKEGLATTRMMAAFEAEALAGRVPRHAVARVPLANGLLEGLPPVVLQHKCDLLALVGPSAKVTPPHILDLLRTCPCNIMVWRPRSDSL